MIEKEMQVSVQKFLKILWATLSLLVLIISLWIIFDCFRKTPDQQKLIMNYNSNTNLLPKDKEVLNGLGKLLGQTDIEGQINQIKLVDDFLNIQIQEANEAKNKNEKLYRTLGMVAGLGIVIILI